VVTFLTFQRNLTASLFRLTNGSKWYEERKYVWYTRRFKVWRITVTKCGKPRWTALSQWLLTLRLLMPYIHMEHLFLMFLDHTQRRSTVGRTPLDEWSARRRDFYLTTHDTHNRQISMPPVGFEPKISAGERPQIYFIPKINLRN